MSRSNDRRKREALEDGAFGAAGVVRLAVISDTHLPAPRRAIPAKCLGRMREADLILHAGDISTTAVLDELEGLGPPVRAVHGNVDQPALQRRLPAELELRLGSVLIAMTHDAGPAHGRLQRMRRRFPQAAAVIFGHSHLPLHEAHGDGFQIFNPGSPTQPRRAPHPTMGLARVDGSTLSLEHLVV